MLEFLIVIRSLVTLYLTSHQNIEKKVAEEKEQQTVLCSNYKGHWEDNTKTSRRIHAAAQEKTKRNEMAKRKREHDDNMHVAVRRRASRARTYRGGLCQPAEAPRVRQKCGPWCRETYRQPPCPLRRQRNRDSNRACSASRPKWVQR